MEIVHGFVLRMNPADEKRFQSLYKEVLDNKLNKRSNVPVHLTLSIASFKDETEVARIIKILEKYKSEFFPITVKVNSVQPVGDSYIGLSIDSPHINSLHSIFMDRLQPGLKNKYRPRYVSEHLLPQEVIYLHEYGYHRVKEFYEPHITIGKYETELLRDQEIENAPKTSGTYVFDRLVFDESDFDQGNMDPKILWETVLTK